MLICVEGLIGQGKSTLVSSLEGEHFFEPVESNPFLELYYKDPKRWAYAMQVNLLTERFAMFQRAQWHSGSDAILDRSFYGDYAFAVVQYKQGLMTDEEFKSYKRLHRLHQHYLGFPDLILRLDCSLATTMSRINERARGCETGISADYIAALDAAYDDVFDELSNTCRVVTVNAEGSKEEVLRSAQQAIEQVRKELAYNENDYRYPHYKGASYNG